MDHIGLGSKQLAVFDAIHCGHNEFLAHELSKDNVDLNVLDWRKRSCADFAAVMGRPDIA
jgi:hypothetical protein